MTNEKYQKNGLGLSRFGLGCDKLSNANEAVMKDGIATIHAALDNGVTLLNTADFYGSGRSEMLISEGIKGYNRDKYFISLKFGALNAPDGRMYGLDMNPHNVKNYITHSLRRLNLDYIDLYQPSRFDLDIPVEETMGAIADLVKAGYVKHIGVTQVDAEALRKAHSVYPISLVEYQYSLFNRSIEKEILPTARELGIGVVAFGTLAHGLLAGSWSKERIEKSKGGYIPLFFEGNIEKNVALVEKVNEIAKEKQITVSQLAYAWLLSKGEDIISLIGASKPDRIPEALKALDVILSENDIKRIEEAIPENEITGAAFPNMQFRNGRVVQR